MLNKNRFSTLVCALFVLLTLLVSACSSVTSIPFVQTPTPTAAPTSTPVVTPSLSGKSSAPGRNQVQDALKLADLSARVVSANKNGTLTLKSVNKKNDKVQTNASTIVVIPGQGSAKVADIKIGDRVVIDFGKDAASTTVAFVLDLPPGFNPGDAVIGALKPNRGGDKTLVTRRGDLTLATDANTTIVDLSGDQPKLGASSDLQPTNLIVVIGQTSDRALNAQVVIVTDKEPRAILRQAKK
jgi:hypothetical protein